MGEALLSVQNLTTAFHTDRGVLRAVHDVSFEVEKGKTLAVVGESGCGKSVTALSIMRLVPSPPGAIEGGKILLSDKNLLELPERDMRRVRGDRISMIFQEPMTSLNPVYTVGAQIVEAIRIHQKASRSAARAKAIEMLELVGIPSPRDRVDSYPHQLSGGMRQRVMIAMALACNPELLIADEPTTALDVTIQAQILDLLRRLQGELGMSILFITHDLGVVAEFASRVAVMYAGRVVETASVPPLDSSKLGGGPRRLPTIEGVVPDLLALPGGCRFAERCTLRASEPPGAERCTEEEPELRDFGQGRSVRCHLAKEVA